MRGRRIKPTAGTPAPNGLDTLVILFTDVTDSTALTERLGNIAFRAKAEQLDRAIRSMVGDCGGEVIEGITLGDGNLAIFRSARRAIECASHAHSCARSVGFRLHVGLHAGGVIRSATNVHGCAVNIAACICSQASPGQTLVSEAVRNLARTSATAEFADHGLHQLKGITDPHLLYAVTTQTSRT
jgi:class 3 adenylate cyclase